MTEDEPQEPRAGGVLSGLLAPLRLPERVIEALESIAEAAKELPTMRAELVRVRELAEPLEQILPALDGVERSLGQRVDKMLDLVARMEGEESHMNKRIDAVLEAIREMQSIIEGLQDDIERITDRLPEPGEKRGPFEAAKDVLTGEKD